MAIVREPNSARGGITPAEKEKMKEHTELWIRRAFRTDPIEPDKIIPAIEGLYEAASLKKPRVVIAPSPLAMARAYGMAAAICYLRKNPKSPLMPPGGLSSILEKLDQITAQAVS